MISFRSNYQQERDLKRYIKLLEQIFDLISKSINYSQNTSNSYNLNLITTTIRQVILKNDCLDQKDSLLDFFYLCQRKISKNTIKKNQNNKNWLILISQQINCLKALSSVIDMKCRNELKCGFIAISNKTLIKQDKFKETKQITYQQLQVTNQQQFDYDQIEVQQDVKIKTLYFFKWTKFLSHIKSIKRLRLKQIDDLRRSLTFNMYAVKFSYFHNWRKQSKKNKQNQHRFQQIQKICKKNQFLKSIQSFYDIFEIKQIQNKLVQTVQNVLVHLKKRKLISSLKSNKQYEKTKIAKQANIGNLTKLRYIFLYGIQKQRKFQQVKTKTMIHNYNFSQKQYAKCCAKTALQVLKNQIKAKKQKIIQINSFIRNQSLISLFNSFNQIKINNKNFLILKNKLRINFLLKGTKKVKNNKTICDYFQNHNHINKGQCQKQKQKQKMNQLDPQLFKQIQYESLIKKLYLTLSLNKNIKFIRQLNKNLTKMKSFKLSKVSLNHMIKNQFINALKINHKRIQNHKWQIKNQGQFYQKNLVRKCFQNIKLFKSIVFSQEQTLRNIQSNIINRNQLKKAFIKIVNKSNKSKASQKLLYRVQNFVIRNIFTKCFSNSISILKSVAKKSRICHNKRLSLLFSLLQNNQKQISDKCKQIQQNVIKRIAKERLINNLKNKIQLTNKQSELSIYRLQQNQSNFINTLKQRAYQKNHIIDGYQKLQKYLGFSILTTSIQTNYNQRLKLQEKIKLVQYNIIKTNLSILRGNFSIKQTQSINMQNKISLLTKSILKQKLQVFKRHIQQLKRCSKVSIGQKIQKLQLVINKKPFVDKLCFQSKCSYLVRWIDWSQKRLVLSNLSQNLKINKNVSSLKAKISNLQIRQKLNMFITNCVLQKQELDTKSTQLMFLFYKRSKNYLQQLVSTNKSISDCIKSRGILQNSIRIKYFAMFIRNCLIQKYSKVKSFCAVKAYARNLKNKAIKALKIMLIRHKDHSLRDKQNTYQTQHDLIVKINKTYQNQVYDHTNQVYNHKNQVYNNKNQVYNKNGTQNQKNATYNNKAFESKCSANKTFQNSKKPSKLSQTINRFNIRQGNLMINR